MGALKQGGTHPRPGRPPNELRGSMREILEKGLPHLEEFVTGERAVTIDAECPGDIDFRDLPVFLIDSRTRPGQAGSAVIAYRSGGSVAMTGGATAMFGGPASRFLGIYSGRINDQSDLGLVWKATALRDLVDSLT